MHFHRFHLHLMRNPVDFGGVEICGDFDMDGADGRVRPVVVEYEVVDAEDAVDGRSC